MTSIHPDAHVGAVHLTVSDLDRSLDFYENNIGFNLRLREGDTAHLGAGGPDILVLTGKPDAKPVGRTTGLYHYAVLTPSRLALAKSLARIIERRVPVTGFADHGVSEAIYLPDPDGNGIEIYRDRPRDEWPRSPDGSLAMVSDPIDLDGVLGELGGQPPEWHGLEAGTVIGHMHLHVSHLEESERFYAEVIGFDLLMSLARSASFLSAGGYHHHLGINVWAGVGAPAPPPDAVGLRHWELIVPNQAETGRVADRARKADISVEEAERGLLIRDPSQNGVMLVAG